MKRFLAYELVKQLKQQQLQILSLLEEGVTPADKKKEKIHEIFEPSFDAKLLYPDAYSLQKLEYIHQKYMQWQIAISGECVAVSA